MRAVFSNRVAMMCRTCGWKETREQIVWLREQSGSEYDWAYDTLDDILQRIDASEHVTPRQKRAVTNIQLGSRHGRGW